MPENETFAIWQGWKRCVFLNWIFKNQQSPKVQILGLLMFLGINLLWEVKNIKWHFYFSFEHTFDVHVHVQLQAVLFY